MNFDRATTIEFWDPNPSPIECGRERRWLLWPALAYEVSAYEPRPRALNLFQEFTLKLCQCGAREPIMIGERLGMSDRIARVILGQLRANGFLDEESIPTHMGLSILEGKKDEEPVPVIGRIYLNPFSGNLWPRLTIGSRRRFEVIRVRGGFGQGSFRVKFEAATAGRPARGEATAIVPGYGWRARVEPPTVQNMLSACRLMRRHRQNYQRYSGIFSKKRGNDNLSILDEMGPIEEISLISRMPEPVFLATFLFVPERIELGSNWQVCDPFGLGTSLPLRQQIESLIAHDEGTILRNRIEDLTHQAYGVAQADLAELLARQHQRASDTVLARLGPEIRNYHELFPCLVAMEEAMAEAQVHADAAGQGYKLLQSRLKDVLGRMYAALEELCSAVQRQYPGENTIAAFSTEVEANSEMLGRIALEKLGFVDDPDSPRFPGFFKISGSEIVGIVKNDRHNLRSQLAALLTAANDRSEHPLFRLAREFPEALIKLYEIKLLRDAASHGGRDSLTIEQATEARDVAYRCVSGLLSELRPAIVGDKGDARPESEQWQVALLHRLRAQAVRQVEERVGVSLRELPELHGLLVEMRNRAIELELMRDQVGSHLDFEGKLLSFMIKASAALEATLENLLRTHTRGDREILPETFATTGDRAAKEQNARLISEIAHSLGFHVPEDGLPEDLTHVPADRILKTLKDRRGTLNSLTLALLLEAGDSRNHPFRKLALIDPKLVLVLSDLSRRRGHGDRVRVEIGEVGGLSGTILGLMASLIKFLV